MEQTELLHLTALTATLHKEGSTFPPPRLGEGAAPALAGTNPSGLAGLTANSTEVFCFPTSAVPPL